MSLFDKIKKIFSNDVSKNKTDKESKNSNKDYSNLTKNTSLEGVNLDDLPPSFRKLTENKLAEKQSILNERNQLQSFWDQMLPVLTVSSKDRKSIIELRDIALKDKEHIPLSFPSMVFQNVDVLFGIKKNNKYNWLNYKQMDIAKGLPLSEIPKWAFQNLFSQFGETFTINLDSNGIYNIKNGGKVESSLTMIEDFWEKIFSKLFENICTYSHFID